MLFLSLRFLSRSYEAHVGSFFCLCVLLLWCMDHHLFLVLVLLDLPYGFTGLYIHKFFTGEFLKNNGTSQPPASLPLYIFHLYGPVWMGTLNLFCKLSTTIHYVFTALNFLEALPAVMPQTTHTATVSSSHVKSHHYPLPTHHA